MGVSGFSVDPKRAKEVDFSDTYYIDDQAIAVMQGGSITKDNVETYSADIEALSEQIAADLETVYLSKPE